MIMYEDVRAVYKAGLCMGCGSCEGVCPAGAVQLKLDLRQGMYVPTVADQRCMSCGLCVAICPGLGAQINSLASEFLDGAVKDSRVGVHHSCYIGYSGNDVVRQNASSGGLITSLLIYCFQNKLIDGALVLGMSKDNPLNTRPFIAKTIEDVLSAYGSKYCPSPSNAALKDILSQSGRFAVVGLPCHIHALRKLEHLKPFLDTKVVLVLGLFCANNNTYLGTEYFLRNNHISTQNVAKIDYRGEGWPGKIVVTLKNGIRRVIPRGTTEPKWYRRALFSSAFHYDFMVPRCLLCPDQTCQLADIAFGDPWLPQYLATEKIGQSLVIARNRRGLDLLHEAMEAGADHGRIDFSGTCTPGSELFFQGKCGRSRLLAQSVGLATPIYDAPEVSKGDILPQLRYLPSYDIPLIVVYGGPLHSYP